MSAIPSSQHKKNVIGQGNRPSGVLPRIACHTAKVVRRTLSNLFTLLTHDVHDIKEVDPEFYDRIFFDTKPIEEQGNSENSSSDSVEDGTDYFDSEEKNAASQSLPMSIASRVHDFCLVGSVVFVAGVVSVGSGTVEILTGECIVSAGEDDHSHRAVTSPIIETLDGSEEMSSAKKNHNLETNAATTTINDSVSTIWTKTQLAAHVVKNADYYLANAALLGGAARAFFYSQPYIGGACLFVELVLIDRNYYGNAGRQLESLQNTTAGTADNLNKIERLLERFSTGVGELLVNLSDPQCDLVGLQKSHELLATVLAEFQESSPDLQRLEIVVAELTKGLQALQQMESLPVEIQAATNELMQVRQELEATRLLLQEEEQTRMQAASDFTQIVEVDRNQLARAEGLITRMQNMIKGRDDQDPPQT